MGTRRASLATGLAASLAALLCAGAAPALGGKLLTDLRVLSADNMEGRGVGTPGGARARRYLAGRLAQVGLEPVYPDYMQPFSGRTSKGATVQGVNLVGRIRGTGRSDKVLILSAHYDHLGVRDGKIYNGADDNASGAAALLAIAEAFKRRRPEHTVIFVLLDGEEVGSPGAEAFLKAPPVPVSRMALNMNLDMVARGDKGELYVAGAHHYPFLKSRFESLAKGAPVTLKLGHDGPPWTGSDDWTSGSDHRVFHQAHVPFAYFGVEDHPDYHKPTDDFAKVPEGFYRRSVALLTTAARSFDAQLDDIHAASGRPL